jgi:murein DD-endopeptidase MepM/ murein hydrolase activator NlpD
MTNKKQLIKTIFCTLSLFLLLAIPAEGQNKKKPVTSRTSFVVDLADIPDTAWCYPLPNAKVISGYGRRGKRSHSGVDIKTKANDSIYAAFSGTVTMSQRYAGYGNCIVVKHATGFETLYSHNSKNFVEVGDVVKAGQVIALTGRTGRATTEHLHFEVRVGKRHYNPSILFDHSIHQLKKHKLTFRTNGSVSTK